MGPFVASLPSETQLDGQGLFEIQPVISKSSATCSRRGKLWYSSQTRLLNSFESNPTFHATEIKDPKSWPEESLLAAPPAMPFCPAFKIGSATWIKPSFWANCSSSRAV